MSRPGDYARAARAEPPSPELGNQPSPASEPEEGRGFLSLVGEVLGILVTALVLSMVVKTFIVQAFFIPSGSMESTLHGCDGCVGDRVLVNKLTDQMGGVQRGDVVVFHDSNGWLTPHGMTPDVPKPGPAARGREALTFVGLAPATSESDLVKRVIGVGGDTVEGRDGKVYVNGNYLDEPYVYAGDKPTDVDFKVTVPADKLWVMGDHRSASGDSRRNQSKPGKGFVPVEDVAGRAFAIIWPLNRTGALERPNTFYQNFDVK